jgi:uncharacterized membrane protein YqiK
MAYVWLVPVALIGLPILFWLFNCIKNIGSTQIAITERRFLGKELESGRAFAMNGQVGIQAKYLAPGLKIIFWPVVRIAERVNFVTIGSDELGIVSATDGESMPSGRILAEDKAGEHHDNFQDPVAFLAHGGVRGEQLRFLTNGQFKLHPKLFQIRKIAKTYVPDGKVGVVYAADGASLAAGQLVGRSVEGHDNFQKAEVFLKNGGQKGPQVDILRPGTYNIHTGMFRVDIREAITVEDGNIGVVEALGGMPMPKGDVIVDSPDGHHNFQDGEAFLKANGMRGPQTSILAPGRYYINPYLFQVTTKPQTIVKQGEVAVLIANHGKDPSEDMSHSHEHDNGSVPNSADPKAPAKSSNGPVEGGATDSEESRLNSGNRTRHVVSAGFRGIQKETLGPGRYNVNPLMYQVVIVPTTTRSLHWAAENEKGSTAFDPFEVVSNDGFPMKVEVRCQYRVLPENAPYVIAKLGSIQELEVNVIHPQIDGIFRAEVSKSPAIAYQQTRADEQKKAEVEVRSDLSKYKVEVVSVMITNIHLPEQLMQTTQEKNLAEQRKSMYDAQEAAEQRRAQFVQTKARADQQADIIKAQTGIEVAQHKANQTIEEAKGEARRIELTAEANAKRTKLEGEAEAAATLAKGEATGKAYKMQVEAMGQNGVALVEVIERIANKGLRITPDIVAGGSTDGGGNLGAVITALLTQQLTKNDAGAAAAAPAADASTGAGEK